MNNSQTWYRSLIKPTWVPPAWLFGPVWTFLYIIIAITYGYVGYLFFTKQVPFIVVLPFILNLFFNIIFTWLQFGIKLNSLAMVDVLLVLITLVWAMAAIYPHVRWIALTNIPYLMWVCFATTLQVSITFLNFKK